VLLLRQFDHGCFDVTQLFFDAHAVGRTLVGMNVPQIK
jgi:hypothetical protein